MTEFEKIIKDFLSNAFKKKVDTGLGKKAHSNNITMSDWNSLVDYCEHLLKDVALTVQVLKEISNKGALIDAVNTAEIVYGTGADGAYKEYRVDSDTNGWTQSNNLVRRDVYGGIRVAVPDSGYVDNYAATVEQVRTAEQNAIDYTKSLRLSIDDAYKLTITDSKGETISNAIDLPLEDLITTIAEVEIGGKYYLQLTLRNGTTVPIELDDIFEGFVKSEANPAFKNSVYGISNNGEDILYPTDRKLYTGITFSTIVLRKLNGDIYLPNSSDDNTSAARVGQVKWALEQAINHTDIELEYATTMFEDSINTVKDRLDQLESASLKYTEYSSITDAVPVPENAAKYAIIDKVGGMTHKVAGDNLWDTKSTVASGNGITVNYNGSITLNGEFDGSITLAIPTGGTYLSLGTTELDRYNTEHHARVDLSKYVEENDHLDETNLPFIDGRCSWPSGYDAYLTFYGTFDDITIYPMLVEGNEPKPYKPFSKILRSTDVISIRSEEANGTLVDAIDIPEAVKNRLPEHFEFGDGIDKDVCNYLNLETETVHGNVAKMVLDGSEDDWKVKTSSTTGITRLQINYSEAPGYLGYPAASAPSTREATMALCNAYESVSASANNSGAKGIAFSATTFFVHDPYFTLAYFESEAAILEAWLAHLQENPLTVVYKVAEPLTESVSDIIGDTFNRLVVSPLGKVKPMSEYGTAAPISISFVEAKGIDV